MKLFIILVLSVSVAHAGEFLRKGLYINHDLVLGFGKNVSEAKADAQKAIPVGYSLDVESNSPAISCSQKEIYNPKDNCKSEKVRIEMPVI